MKTWIRRISAVPGRTLQIIALFIALLLILRFLLPIGMMYGINWALENKVPGYYGYIKDFDLSLLRGRYWIKDLHLEKRDAQDLPPLLRVNSIEVALSWDGLFQGKLLTTINVLGATVHLFDSKDEAKDQMGNESDFDWRELYWSLVPFKVEEFNLYQSAIYFANLDVGLEDRVFFSDIRAHVLNIQNLKRDQARLPTPIFLRGQLQGKTEVKVEGRLNFLRSPIELDGELKLVDFELPDINTLLLAYLPLSFEAGKISLFAEVATYNRQLKGYVKPFVDEVRVMGEREVFLSFPHLGIEFLTAAANLLFRDGDHTIATKIEFSGSFDDPEVKTGKAFWRALENAYTSKELKREIEHSISQQELFED